MRQKAPVFCLFLLVNSMAVNSQFTKGDKMVGASVASIIFNSGSSDVSFPQTRGYSGKITNYSLKIEPTFGWFISGNTAVGASLFINPNGQKASYEDLGTTFQKDKSANFNIGVGAFIRNYFGAGNSFRPFGHFGFNTGISSSTTDGFKYFKGSPDFKQSYDGKSSGGFFANTTLQFGLTKMVNENTGLDIYLGYNYSFSKNTFKTTTVTDNAPYDGIPETSGVNEPTTKYSSHGVIFGVGLQVFLKGKKK
jgi:hypothetical protein